MGLVPLGVVTWRWWTDGEMPAQYWWLGVAFAVSWLADSAAHWLNPWTVTFVYVVGQSCLVAAVFLSRRDAIAFLGAMLVVGVIAILAQPGRDFLLHIVGWASVACVVAEQGKALSRMRAALLVYFGLGVVAYVVYAGWPSFPTWGAYQLTRLAGILVFCAALRATSPHLAVLRSAREARVA